MGNLLANAFRSPRTTLAGLWTAIMLPQVLDIMPKVATYLGSQPSLGWQLLGAGITLLLPALMPDAKKAP